MRESGCLRKEKRLSEHPTPAELESFLNGKLAPDSFRKIARHLIRGCSSCNGLLAPHFEPLIDPQLSDLRLDSPKIHAEVLARLFTRLRAHQRHLRREETRRRRITFLLEGLGSLEALLEEVQVPLRGLGTLQALLDRSWAVRHENTQEMVRLARYAVDVARRLDAAWLTQEEIADWQARAWGELGNAHRASDDLYEAERAFGKAFDLLLEGTNDLYLKARLNDLYASYWGTRRQFDLAFAALDIARAAYLELGDVHLAGRTLIVKATYTFYAGRPKEGIRINDAGMALLQKERDPELLFLAIHNRLSYLVACGEFREAKNELFRQQAQLLGLGGHLNALKMRWLRAQISVGLQEWHSAEIGFLEVKEGFESAGMGFAAALASLELALVWMRQNRYQETEVMVLETSRVFMELKIHREALGAILVLKEAFERQLATVGLLKDVVDFLRRSMNNPDARFEPREE